jgi:hypothetical protein
MRRAHLPPTTSVSGASNKRRHVVTTVACPPSQTDPQNTHTLHAGLGHHAHDHHVTVIAPPMPRAMASRPPHRTRPHAGSRPRHGPRRTAPEQYEHENREADHHAHQRAGTVTHAHGNHTTHPEHSPVGPDANGDPAADEHVISLLAQRTLRKSQLRKITPYFTPGETGDVKEKVNLGEIFTGKLRSRTIGLWIISWMTFSSQVAITVFLPTVLVAEGFSFVNSLFYSMVINVGGLLGAIFASYFAAKLGRKQVLGWP